MSGPGDNRPLRWIAAHPWLVAGFVLYATWLTYVVATLPFGEQNAVRQYAAQVAQRPPAPLPELPATTKVDWPDIALRRDPFAPIAETAKQSPMNQGSSEQVPLRRPGESRGPF